MTVMPFVRVGIVTVLVSVSLSAQHLSVELQRIAQQETVTGDLRAAIDSYKRIVARAGSNREVAAKALVRMAESYQKLGDVEARAVYARIVREFPDRKEEVALASARLGGAAPVASVKGDRAVWTGPNVDLSGRVSPDGRFITSVDWNNGRLMIHDVATNVDRALTPAAEPIYSQAAQWSAMSRDGKQIVYEWMGNGRVEVRIAALPGSGFLEPRQLVLANAASFSSFDWSPDGKWIATTFERTDGTGQIGLISVADGSFRSLKSVDRSVLNTLRNLTSIFFSPDGKYLAYDRPPTGTSQQRDVFVLAVDGSRDIPAVVHGANDFVMGWSPDGTRLLFRSDRTGSWALWAQSFADGRPQGSAELLKSDIGRSVSLGVTTSGALYLYKRISTRDITISPIDLAAGRLLGPPVGFPQGFIEGAGNPTWSPDGRYLTYPVTCDNGCLAIRSVATGQVRRLAPTISDIGAHAWSPDGRSLLAVGRNGQGMFRIDVQSGEATAVIPNDGSLGPVAGWSPDRMKVYFNRGDAVVERDMASGSERVVHREAGGLRFTQLSPDGQYVFGGSRFDPSTQTASFLLVPVAGGQPRELLAPREGFGLLGAFQWTPDSRAVIATKNPLSRGRELWLVPVTGGGPRKLDIDPDVWMEDATGGGDRGFSVSPDGRSIAFPMGRTGAEVWALENFLPARAAKR